MGYVDAATGLVTEPIEGAKAEVRTSVRLLFLTERTHRDPSAPSRASSEAASTPACDPPLACSCVRSDVCYPCSLTAQGLIEHTATGAVQSVKKTLRHREAADRFAARRHEGVEALAASTEPERQAIVKAFDELKDGAADRRARYRKEVEAIAGPLVAAGLHARPEDDE
jgi:hypothetical protein